jgi:hypothetical protein
METRRTRRIQNRHNRLVAVVVVSVGVLGFGIGLALPRGTTVALLLLALAVVGIATAGLAVAVPEGTAVLERLRSRFVPDREPLFPEWSGTRGFRTNESAQPERSWSGTVRLRARDDDSRDAMELRSEERA